MKIKTIFSVLICIFMCFSGCSGSSFTALKEEPFNFIKDFPVKPGLKLVRKDQRTDTKYQISELVYHSSQSTQEIYNFYSKLFRDFGLQEYGSIENLAVVSNLNYFGWPDGKLISVQIRDNSMTFNPALQRYQKSNKKSEDYRIFEVSLSRRIRE